MDKTIEWLRRAECKDGGISAWYNKGEWYKPYPEVSAYLIPTLLEWREEDLAWRIADWLIRIQNKDGSWNGLDDTPRPFDTAAVIEGLNAMIRHCPNLDYSLARERAIRWIASLIRPEGYIPNSPHNKNPEIYNLRASAIIGNRAEADYWQAKETSFPPVVRSHYLAYHVEGLLNLGVTSLFIGYMYEKFRALIPFTIQLDETWKDDVFDLCATAQWGIIFDRVGLDARRYYEAMLPYIADNGGVPQSTTDPRQIAWGAKFFLDFKRRMEK